MRGIAGNHKNKWLDDDVVRLARIGFKIDFNALVQANAVFQLERELRANKLPAFNILYLTVAQPVSIVPERRNPGAVMAGDYRCVSHAPGSNTSLYTIISPIRLTPR